jgi:hypothetical protein
VVSIDSFSYYGTDDLLSITWLASLKPGGVLGIAGAGLMQEIEGALPKHLQAWWSWGLVFALSAVGGADTGKDRLRDS